jgi:anti-sigma B factor antagonist
MNLTSWHSRDALIVRVGENRIDSLVAIQFKDAMRQLTSDDAELAPRVILDLSQVLFVDSSGLGAIVAAMKFLAPRQRLELAALQPNVARVFHLTRMDSVFNIHAQAPDGEGSDAA